MHQDWRRYDPHEGMCLISHQPGRGSGQRVRAELRAFGVAQDGHQDGKKSEPPNRKDGALGPGHKDS